MARQFAEIVSLLHYRKNRDSVSALRSRAMEVRDQYNGDIVIPLPELDREEKNAVANLLQKGLDQMAMRTASTQPDPFFAPTRPGIEKQEKLAEDRKKAMLGFWDMNEMEVKDARGSRAFYAYGSSPRVILPDFNRKIPKWELRDPLQTFPAPSNDPDNMTPDDCIFTYYQPLWWVRQNYENAFNEIRRARLNEPNMDEMFEIVEYIDAEDIVLGIVGSKARGQWDDVIKGRECMELVRTPNRAGICTAVIPGRVTLDRPMGQFDGMIGMYRQQAMLQALGVIATKKGIFRDEWIVARPNEIPQIIRPADGLRGKVGMIQGAEFSPGVNQDPSYTMPQMIDRLEASMRMEGGIPSQMTGYNPTNVRTGRASDALLGATVDFTIQEAQKVLARSRVHEDVRAAEIDKGYWKKPKSFYINFKGKSERLDYKPEELWEHTHHRVEYAHAGVDENGRTIEIGQLLGMELIPKRDARRMHPLIKDPEAAENAVMGEAIDGALLAGLLQKASTPGENIADIARIKHLVLAENMDLGKAILQVQEEAQKRQASVDEEGNPDVAILGSPETMPGMAAPGMGAEAASVPPPDASMVNVANLFSRARQPAMAIAAERGPGA